MGMGYTFAPPTGGVCTPFGGCSKKIFRSLRSPTPSNFFTPPKFQILVISLLLTLLRVVDNDIMTNRGQLRARAGGSDVVILLTQNYRCSRLKFVPSLCSSSTEDILHVICRSHVVYTTSGFEPPYRISGG